MNLTLVLLVSLSQYQEDMRTAAGLMRDLMSNDSTTRYRGYVLAMSKLESGEARQSVEARILTRAKHIVRNRKITEREGTLHWSGERDSEEYLLACLLDKIDNGEATEVLIQFVSLESYPSPIAGEWTFVISGSFPVAGLLAKKGPSIIPPVIKALENIDSNGRRRRNLCWVLHQSAGPQRAVQIIEERCNQLSGKPRVNLEACLGMVSSNKIMPNPPGGVLGRSYDFNIR